MLSIIQSLSDYVLKGLCVVSYKLVATCFLFLLFGLDLKAEVDVKYDIQFRNRYSNRKNLSLTRSARDDDIMVEAQGVLGLNLQAGENLLTRIDLLYTSQFGKTREPGGENDNFYVNQVYGWWKTSDALSIWFGRFDIHIGNGQVFSKNSYEPIPYAYDGLRFGFLTDFAELDLYVIKLSELSSDTVSSFSTGDPEAQIYLLNVSFKNLVEVLNRTNLHFGQIVRDETKIGSVSFPTQPSKKLQHLSLSFEGAFNVFYYGLHFSQQFGQQKGVSATNVLLSQNFTGQLLDFHLGLDLPDFYRFRFWVGYHWDSGGEDDPLKEQDIKTYQSLFYDHHQNAGRMDFLKWGNLRYYRLGFDFYLLEEGKLGLEYLIFEKTDKTGAVNLLDTLKLKKGTVLSTSTKSLGAEVDFWYIQELDEGLLGKIRLSAFFPGDVFSKSSTLAEETSYQILGSIHFHLK